jgi:hypothetical protein
VYKEWPHYGDCVRSAKALVRELLRDDGLRLTERSVQLTVLEVNSLREGIDDSLPPEVALVSDIDPVYFDLSVTMGLYGSAVFVRVAKTSCRFGMKELDAVRARMTEACGRFNERMRSVSVPSSSRKHSERPKREREGGGERESCLVSANPAPFAEKEGIIPGDLSGKGLMKRVAGDPRLILEFLRTIHNYVPEKEGEIPSPGKAFASRFGGSSLRYNYVTQFFDSSGWLERRKSDKIALGILSPAGTEKLRRLEEEPERELDAV